MKNTLIATLMTGIGMLVLACSGSPDMIGPIPPGPGPGNGPALTLTDEERIAALNECKGFVDALGDLKSEAAQLVLVAWLKTRPEFEEADTLGGNVWAYFHDGRVVMFVPDWRSGDENDGGRVAQPVEVGGNKTVLSAGRTQGQPSSNHVKMYMGLGTAFTDYRPFLSSIFTISDTEYVVGLEEATIENLKSANNLGVFFIDTHGGVGRTKPRSANRGLFGLWTKDTASVASERIYERELNSNYLVYMLARQNLGAGSEVHYAITEHFVRNPAYMNMAENALIFIDACNGMTGNATGFREAIVSKAKGGKATYIGWTGLTNDVAGEAAAGFIFDRMLGTNIDLNASTGTIAAEDPEQRPFDFDQIFGDLGTFSAGGYPLGVSRHGGRLAYQSVHASEIILTPSIEYITVDDYNSQITIKGFFGDKEGAIVTVGGVSVPAKWSPNELICDIPVTGPGSSGNVIVTINHNKSNVVPLSEWTIPLHIVKDDFGVKVDVRLNLKIRADVHKFRSEPGEQPRTERPAIPLPPGFLGFPCSAGSSGTFRVGGVRTQTCNVAGCTLRDTESILTREGTVPFSITQPGLAFGAYYIWSKDLKKIEVFLNVHIPDCSYEMDTYSACPGGDPVTSRHNGTTPLGVYTSKQPAFPMLVFHLDENYDIKWGDINGTQNIPWGRCEALPAYFKHSVTWPTVTPTVRPTADTEARFASVD